MQRKVGRGNVKVGSEGRREEAARERGKDRAWGEAMEWESQGKRE
jgi:hypothetical protein